MSVINKMLRDLDHRANPAATDKPDPSSLRQGTASVSLGNSPSVSATAGVTSRLWLGLGGLAVAGAALGGWLWWSANTDAQKAASVQTAAVTATPVSATTPTPAPTFVPASQAVASIGAASEPDTEEPQIASAPVAAATDVPIAPAAVSLRMESSLSARKALDALLSKSANAQPSASPSNASIKAAAPVAAAPVAATVDFPKPRGPASAAALIPASAKATAAAAAATAANSTPVLQRQQQAGGDVMAQVQSLWSSGSHDAAIDLMQQSIAAAERGAKAGASGTSGAAPGGSAVLVPLVREMARMQLAEARFGAVWEMLTRLEPLLGNQADLWAIRANAAQRLGRHQDSVRAYTMALQSRPDEQRWLLGTAVSLAALGQTNSAAEMADKARAVGPVSKEILAYLRQTGVPIRD